MLFDAFCRILGEWRGVFLQVRTYERAVWLTFGLICSVGRRSIAAVLELLGHGQRDWSASYRLWSRSPWDANAMFRPVLKRALGWVEQDYVAVAVDDTSLPKSGKKIPGVHWRRDPQSPRGRINLVLALRFLTISVLLAHYRSDEQVPPRSVPIGFDSIPPVKKPKKDAPAEQWAQYRADSQRFNASTAFVTAIRRVRAQVDSLGAADKKLIVVVDGSFCNRTVFGANLDRTVIVARARKDAKLCLAAPSASKRFYSEEKFTPQDVRQDRSRPYFKAMIFHGGMFRQLRYKELSGVLWQGGARRRPLRLLVLAATAYKNYKNGPLLYRRSACLLTDDLETPAATLIQCYADRWQIEVTHREIKTAFGVGQAQLRSQLSVPRQPTMAVAAYAALLMASLEVFGAGRSTVYEQLPKWRRNAKRPSCHDLVTVLRREMMARTAEGLPALRVEPRRAVLAAAA